MQYDMVVITGREFHQRQTNMPSSLTIKQLNSEELDAGLDEIRRSPSARGPVEMIVRRPAPGEREILLDANLDIVEGLCGDSWKARGNPKTVDGLANPETQLTLMNSRAISLIAQSKERWSLAGDQLYIDLDLSIENIPPGTRLSVGTAIVEISPIPHTGCKKFVERFGMDAMLFVNSEIGRALNLRGVNARVIKAGVVRPGDSVVKLPLAR